MFNKINSAVSTVLVGLKTNINTGLLGMLSMYLATKGFDLSEIQIWLNNVFTSIESLIVVLTGLGVYFRQISGLVKPKKKAKKAKK